MATFTVVSASSLSVAPAFRAFWVWISMQYGHCVVSATAIAISSLYLSGITPPRTTASSKATKALNASGASSASVPIFASLFLSYIACSFGAPPVRSLATQREIGRGRMKHTNGPGEGQSTQGAPGVYHQCSPCTEEPP